MMTDIDEQVAAVRRMCEGDTQPHTIREARAALATLEQHKLALAVVEAAREAAYHDTRIGCALGIENCDGSHGCGLCCDLRSSLAAFDAGEKPR
jgi:hypothetical protein